jgi:hypothetical protein
MAARLNPSHSEEIRKKIQASQLINRLTGHVNGEVEMSGTQVTAALGLLKKAVPDLAAITLSGDPEQPLTVQGMIELRAVYPKKE